MIPYYESDLATLYCGNALDVLPALPRGSVDCIATDPPYGVSFQSGFRHDELEVLAGDDGSLDVIKVLVFALRALKKNRHIYVFGPADLTELPLGPTSEIIWDKVLPNLGDLSLPWGCRHERISFAMYVDSKYDRERGTGRLAARLRQGSILTVPRRNGTNVKRHPTEKPVALMRQLIESSTLLGETVLDPFAGAGSTLVAAVAAGRKAVGVELDRGFCDTIVERLRAVEVIARQLDAL